MSYRIGEGGYLDDELKGRLNSIRQKIDRASVTELAAAEYIDALKGQLPTPIVMLESDYTKKLTETRMKVGGFQGEIEVPADRVTVRLPTSGSVELLRFRPSQSLMTVFECTVEGNSLVFVHDQPSIDLAKFNSWWGRALSTVQKQVGFVNFDVERHIGASAAQLEAAVAARKARLEDLDRRRQELGAS